MNQKIQEFWNPYWTRDSVQDLTDEGQWDNALQIIDQATQQFPEINIPTTSVDAWRSAIDKTKTRTAKGSCGFSKAELQSLSNTALQDLVDLTASFA